MVLCVPLWKGTVPGAGTRVCSPEEASTPCNSMTTCAEVPASLRSPVVTLISYTAGTARGRAVGTWDPVPVAARRLGGETSWRGGGAEGATCGGGAGGVVSAGQGPGPGGSSRRRGILGSASRLVFVGDMDRRGSWKQRVHALEILDTQTCMREG